MDGRIAEAERLLADADVLAIKLARGIHELRKGLEVVENYCELSAHRNLSTNELERRMTAVAGLAREILGRTEWLQPSRPP